MGSSSVNLNVDVNNTLSNRTATIKMQQIGSDMELLITVTQTTQGDGMLLVTDADGNEIGEVTSGTQSPSMEQPIGMGYVSLPFSQPGTKINVVAGNKRLSATVAALPLYKG